LWLPAQDYLTDFQYITTEDGLANLSIAALHKDKRGFMWMSNNYGLNRYDGNNFELYTKEDNGLFSNSNIHQIEETEEGLLWLFYTKRKNEIQKIWAIDIFNPITKKVFSFEEYYKDIAPFSLSDILYCQINDAKNRICITTISGAIYILEKGNFTKIFEKKGGGYEVVTIDDNDNIWIGIEGEVWEVNKNGEIINKYPISNNVYSIFVENNKTWIVTYIRNGKSKVWEVTKDKKLQEIKFYKKGKSILDHSEGSTVAYTKNGYWIIRILNRILVYDNNYALVFDSNEIRDHPIIKSNLLKLLADENKIWLVSDMGLYKLSINKNPFHHINPNAEYKDNRGIVNDNNGNVYLINGTLHHFRSGNGVPQKISELGGGANLLLIDSLLISGSNKNGFIAFEYNLVTKEEKEYPFVEGWEKNNSATTLFQLKNSKRILIGTKKGLGYLDINSKKTIKFEAYGQFPELANTKIFNITNSSTGILIGTQIGIFLMDDKGFIIRKYSKSTDDLPYDKIRHIYEDEDGIFWLSSAGKGIIKWQPSLTNQPSIYQQYTKKDGLSNDNIYAIYEDDFGNLWASSDRGLMCIEKSTFNISTFLTTDGLPHYEFNSQSHHQSKDGTFYFGGLGGIIRFHPKDLANQTISNTPFIITNLSILEDKKETLTDITAQLKTNKIIKIKPTDKLLELHFMLLDYEKLDFHSFQYKIEGYSKQWTTIAENYIRITSLPYGNYTIRIKGQHFSKGWSNQELAIKIKIVKPFYLQWWFIGLITIIVIGLVFWINRQRIQRLENEKENLEIEVKKRTLQIEEDKLIIGQQAKDLKALDIAKTKFFSNITHEFRTPLTLILGPAQQLQKQKLPKAIQNHVFNIKNNAYHLLELVNQLLDLSKLEVGKMPIQLVQHDVIDFTKSLIKQLQPLAEVKSQYLDFQSNDSEWITDFDKEKWQKIVFNLLSNAIKFTPNNGQITIELNQTEINEKSNIILKIKDTGIGIPTEKQPYIFDRFHQVDNSDTRIQQGTGIGLALVKELVQLQNGQVTVESEHNIGTTFTITIPTLAQGDFHQTVTTNIATLPTISTPLKLKEMPSIFNANDALRLLIIEDNAGIRDYIKSCLSEHNFEIIEAENGQIGIEKAIEFVPDLIISDVMMPIKDGFEVTKTIRQNTITSHIPIILLTAKTALESRLEGIKRGADVYLTKPFSAEELILRIYKLIELRQSLQQHYTTQKQPNKSDDFQQEDQFITSFKTYIISQLDNSNLDNETLGKAFAMSRMQLHRKVKALTGLAIGEYVRLQRLEAALELVKEKKLSLSEIAYQTGFASLSHFSRTFKKHYQKSPSQF
jgi:signal transduction histidine kinase/DNA-binding response OmpR family regulator/ligand-binding sensor domain-containing protein